MMNHDQSSHWIKHHLIGAGQAWASSTGQAAGRNPVDGRAPMGDNGINMDKLLINVSPIGAGYLPSTVSWSMMSIESTILLWAIHHDLLITNPRLVAVSL